MSEQEITAGELEGLGASYAHVGFARSSERVMRAARTIRRLEGVVSELRERERLLATGLRVQRSPEYAADAELGSLVRRIREHPETLETTLFVAQRGAALVKNRFVVSDLEYMLNQLDTLATRRAAEEGERAPSGRRYRMRGGKLECTNVAAVENEWRECLSLVIADLDVVERVRKGVPRGE